MADLSIEDASWLDDRRRGQLHETAVVAATLLPPTFVTGLLGINVEVIPGSEHPWAVFIVFGFLFGAAAIQFLVFRRLKWI